MRSVAGYVTNNNRKRDRKEAQKGADKNLKEENLNRLLLNRIALRAEMKNGRAGIILENSSFCAKRDSSFFISQSMVCRRMENFTMAMPVMSARRTSMGLWCSL